MTKFDELQKNAEQLAERLHNKELPSPWQGCMTFFSKLTTAYTEKALEDAITIALLASSLDNEYDPVLRPHFSSVDDFSSFKEQILTGLYLLKWVQYNSIANSCLNSGLIGLFQKDLNMRTLASIEKIKLTLCLDSLSRYCSYLYTHQDKSLNSILSARLGDNVQLEIVQICEKSLISSSLLGDIQNCLWSVRVD